MSTQPEHNRLEHAQPAPEDKVTAQEWPVQSGTAQSGEPLRVGTRGSLLATTQAGGIAAQIGGELVIVSTPGDRSQAPVERIGVGVFTQELREALERDECNVAVHSFKDLPTAADPRFLLVVPPRAAIADCLVARDGLTLATLPEGAKVGTSAPRRVAQLKRLRSDLEILPLRGNIDTRMGKVASGELDAVILAYAGLCRVGLADRATQVFDPYTEFLPAPAQGALAVEARVDDPVATAAITPLADAATTECVTAERTLLAVLEAGCTAPIGAVCRKEADGSLTLKAGFFGEEDESAAGTQAKNDTGTAGSEGTTGNAGTTGTAIVELTGTDPVELGTQVAQLLLAELRGTTE